MEALTAIALGAAGRRRRSGRQERPAGGRKMTCLGQGGPPRATGPEHLESGRGA